MPPDVPEASPPTTSPAVAPVGWGQTLIAGTLAGLLAWAGGEWIERANSVRIVSEFEVAGAQQFAQRGAAILAKATLSYGLLGTLLGLALGLVGGAARRSARGAIAGAVAGAILGGIAGAVTARLAVAIFLRNEDTTVSDQILLPLLTHGAIGSALGAAGGLAMAIGLAGPRRRLLHAAFGGLLGAVVATFFYELIGGLAFPLEQTGQPISSGVGSRLFARLVVAILVAAGVTFALRHGQAAEGHTPA
jgi:hypothetical protein